MRKLLLLLTLGVLTLTGCGASSVDVNEEKDNVLTIWSFYEGAPKVALDYYAEQTGNEVQFQAIGWDDFQPKINTVIGTSDAPDLIVLERQFMGSYTTSDAIVSLDEFMADDPALEAYKANTALATVGPGMSGDEVRAIGWENTASAFFYRSDLADTCLGIKTVEEMEEKTATVNGYVDLFEQLQTSDDATCNSMSLVAYPNVVEGALQNAGMYNVVDGAYTFPENMGEILDFSKEAVEKGAIYSPQTDKTQELSGAQKDGYLGNIAPAWASGDIMLYEQPGQWRVADTPIDYTMGGSYLATTSNADFGMVKEYLDMTFLNEEWLVDNMSEFGMVGNQKVMDSYLTEVDGSNEYYGGENTVEKFADINQGIESFDQVTPYDKGLRTIVNQAMVSYIISDGTLNSIDEVKAEIEKQISATFPEITVVDA